MSLASLENRKREHKLTRTKSRKDFELPETPLRLRALARWEGKNTEAQRTRSFASHASSVISVSLCFKSSPTEIAEHGYVLTPGRYMRAEEVEDDGVPFAEKMEGLTRELATQFHESEKLQAAIRDNMQKLGFALPEVGE